MTSGRAITRIVALLLMCAMLLMACNSPTSVPTPSSNGEQSPSPSNDTNDTPIAAVASPPRSGADVAPSASASAQAVVSALSVASPSAVATPEPKIVRIGIPEEPDTITGWPGGGHSAEVVQNLLFNVLVGVDDKMEPFPDLAEQIPTVANGGARWVGEGDNRQLEVTFRLRRGVTWSDGEPFTARDVLFTWELILNPKSGAAPDTELKYEKVVASDDHTVVFTFFSEKTAREAAARDPDRMGRFKDQNGPVIDPLYIFGIPNSYVYPAHVVSPLVEDQPKTSERVSELFTQSTFAQKPVGTGPFTLTEWTAGTSLSFVARNGFHRGAPRISGVAFSIIPKADTLIQKLKSGEIDVITQDALDVSSATMLDKLDSASVYYTPSIAWEHVDLNLSDPILSDVNVRKAIFHAIDRRELIDKVLLGKSVSANSVVPSWSWAYQNTLPVYAYEPEKAADLLDRAGWTIAGDGVREKNGRKLRLQFQTTDAPFRMKSAPLIKDQLRKVGIDVIVEHVPHKEFFEARSGPLSQRTFQMAEYAWVGGFDPGGDLVYAFHSGSIPSRENNFLGGNFAGYQSIEVDRLLDQGLSTLDESERVHAYHSLQDILMDDLPSLPLYVHPTITAVSKSLINFKPPRASIGETWNIHEWDLK